MKIWRCQCKIYQRLSHCHVSRTWQSYVVRPGVGKRNLCWMNSSTSGRDITATHSNWSSYCVPLGSTTKHIWNASGCFVAHTPCASTSLTLVSASTTDYASSLTTVPTHPRYISSTIWLPRKPSWNRKTCFQSWLSQAATRNSQYGCWWRSIIRFALTCVNRQSGSLFFTARNDLALLTHSMRTMLCRPHNLCSLLCNHLAESKHAKLLLKTDQ